MSCANQPSFVLWFPPSPLLQDAIENQLLLIVDGALRPCLQSVLSSFTSMGEAMTVQV